MAIRQILGARKYRVSYIVSCADDRAGHQQPSVGVERVRYSDDGRVHQLVGLLCGRSTLLHATDRHPGRCRTDVLVGGGGGRAERVDAAGVVQPDVGRVQLLRRHAAVVCRRRAVSHLHAARRHLTYIYINAYILRIG